MVNAIGVRFAILNFVCLLGKHCATKPEVLL